MLKLVRIFAVLSLVGCGIILSAYALEAYLLNANIDCSADHHKAAEQKHSAEVPAPLNHLVPPERRQPDAAQPKETHYECLIAKYTIELAAFTKALAWATAALVIATIGLLVLGVLQAQDMKESLRLAKQAADAAERSARAAIGIELPVIRLRPDPVMLGDGVSKEGEKYEHLGVPGITISNLGATKAFPVEILYGWTIGEFLPKEPKYEYLDKFVTNLIIEPTPKITPYKRLTMSKPLGDGDRAKIVRGNFCWFYCDFRYDDFMDERRGHAFCWRWSSKGGGGLEWVEDRTPSYNRKT